MNTKKLTNKFGEFFLLYLPAIAYRWALNCAVIVR